jgi:L-malate glycosyltransferase
LKILYFSRQYTSHDHRFLSAMVSQGFSPWFLKLEPRDRALESRPLPEGVQALHWQSDRLSGPARLLDLKRLLGEVRPDLALAGPVQRTAFLLALAGFRPLVSMSWGYDLLIDARRSRAWEWATRFTLRRSAAMLGDCAAIRRLAVGYGMHPDRIVTFPWGVDLAHFSPGPEFSDPVSPVFTLLCTRGWEPIYGVDVIARGFVQAAQALKAQGGPELRLLMLGGGSQAGLLRQIFQQGGVLEQVSFPGQVGFAGLPRYYRMADLYLSASHSDGSSISLLESMACGTPVLVSDIPGNQEWITPGEQGWLFPDGDAAALAEGIVRAVQERRRLPEMGRRARQLAEERASWERNAQQLSTLFRLALKPVRKNS